MMRVIKRLLVGLLVIVFLVSISGVSILTYMGYKEYENAVSQVSIKQKVNDIRNNNVYVHIDDISEDFKNAIVSIEDHRFYDHKGISIVAIGRALLTNIKSGSALEGGSTLTMQVAKNMYFDNSKELTRKIAEVFLANKLEKYYSKDDILELYVNMIYYGNGYYGIDEAARGYFNVSPKDLDLNKATILAGLPQAPSSYDLTKNNNKAEKRQKIVLKSMVKNGYINQEEADKIINQT